MIYRVAPVPPIAGTPAAFPSWQAALAFAEAAAGRLQLPHVICRVIAGKVIYCGTCSPARRQRPRRAIPGHASRAPRRLCCLGAFLSPVEKQHE